MKNYLHYLFFLFLFLVYFLVQQNLILNFEIQKIFLYLIRELKI